MLIIDDDPVVRLTLSKMVSLLGHAATTASSAQEAMDALDEAAFDVILCDINMPGMTGYQLLDLVVQELPEQAARFVLVSSESEIMRDLATRYGVQCVDKPAHIGRVSDAIERLFAGRGRISDIPLA